MKTSTYAIALSPALIILTVKTVIDPTWGHDYSLLECVAIGVLMGLVAGFAARVVEPRD